MEKLASLTFDNVSYSFGKTAAVSNFSLNIEKGSFTTFLGPSGCGKTTLLRLISGFLQPDSGSIFIDGENQASIPTEKRQVGIVFQDYALFPHITVEKNLLYGLEIKKNRHNSVLYKNKADIKNENIAKIHKTARILGIADLLDRYPHELSGGQQQRVALGRALVLEPKLLLMDEPLSSLDAKLRVQVREELKEIQSELGITTIYVTHDQEEALSMSDKIAVLKNGHLLQEGTPREIYLHPAEEFVADFIGRANFFTFNGKRIGVRPEWILPADNDNYDLTGKIISSSFLGQVTRYKIRLQNSSVITVDLPTDQQELKNTSTVYLKIIRHLEF